MRRSSPARRPQRLGLPPISARLIDDLLTREVPFDRLDGLVPDEFDEYWQKTLLFLQVARVAWPKILAERGAIEAAERRDALIAAEGDRLEESRGPVIAAGSTGSMPATARLLSRIAALPQGAVVLPGLDTDLDETSWALIGCRSACLCASAIRAVRPAQAESASRATP